MRGWAWRLTKKKSRRWQIRKPNDDKSECIMIVDCHSHIFEYPGHIAEEFVAEANARARGKPLNLHVPPERHWKAMEKVDKAIVFGMRAFHCGIVSPNEYIADYVAKHPKKLIGFAAVDPMCDDVHQTLE